jgi:hypothetical protein
LFNCVVGVRARKLILCLLGHTSPTPEWKASDDIHDFGDRWFREKNETRFARPTMFKGGWNRWSVWVERMIPSQLTCWKDRFIASREWEELVDRVARRLCTGELLIDHMRSHTRHSGHEQHRAGLFLELTRKQKATKNEDVWLTYDESHSASDRDHQPHIRLFHDFSAWVRATYPDFALTRPEYVAPLSHITPRLAGVDL